MLGYGSEVINGQLVNVPVAQAFRPLVMGQAYYGPGRWPKNGVYNLPPVLPSPAIAASNSAISYGGGGYGDQPIPTMGLMRSDGSMNYYHPTKSPLLWALAFLGGGLFMLHKVHYSKG